MYESEEVIDEGVQGGEGAYLFGRELSWMRRLLRRLLRRLELRQRVGGIGRRLRCRRFGIDIPYLALLDRFGMPVGRSASSAGALKGTWNLQSEASSTRRA
jgi:hypothetical protein